MPYVAAVRKTLRYSIHILAPVVVAPGKMAVFKIVNYSDCALYLKVECRPEFTRSFLFGVVDPFGLKELQIKAPDAPFGNTVISFEYSYRHEDNGLLIHGAIFHHIIKCRTE